MLPSHQNINEGKFSFIKMGDEMMSNFTFKMLWVFKE